MGGNMGASETYNNAKRFYYWHGMIDWICALTADCLTCQNNKPQPKHRNDIPSEENHDETIPSARLYRSQGTPSATE